MSDLKEVDSKRHYHKELELALKIQQEFNECIPRSPDFDDIVRSTLYALLNAQNKTSFDILFKRLQELSTQIPNQPNQTLNRLLDEFNTKRHLILPDQQTYFQFWLDEPMAMINLLMSILLLTGAVIPPVGIAALLFIVIFSTFDAFDFWRKSYEYFGWDDDPIIGQQRLDFADIQQLQNDFGQKAVNDLHANVQPSKETLDPMIYTTYGVAFIISLLGLISFFFPPIGIPALALFILGFFAITMAMTQMLDTRDKYQTQQAGIEDLKSKTDQDIASDKKVIASIFTITPSNTPSISPSYEKTSQSLRSKSPLSLSPKPLPGNKQDESDDEGEGDLESTKPTDKRQAWIDHVSGAAPELEIDGDKKKITSNPCKKD